MDWWLPEVGGGGGMDEIGEGDKEVQTSNYKVNESWG